jgi:WD40 repeat protein
MHTHRYLAAGSEDKAAYVYDLRTGTLAHRLRGCHGDAVTDVAWSPLHPQLATACLDGRVHFFSEAAG